MTTEQLERDLEQLAEPREADERLRLAIRARLGEQMLVRPPRRRVRLEWRLRWAAGAAAAAAAIAGGIVALGLPGGSAGPSAADAAIIHHALRALALPPNEIVHVKEAGTSNGTAVSAEWWQQTDSPYALRIIKGPEGRQVEAAADGTTSYVYDAGTDTVVKSPATSAPDVVDPIAGVRDQLAHGDAHVDGTVSIDGQSLYKIELPTGVIGYFDTSDYRPVYLDNPQPGGSVVRTRVVTYEELPATSENAKLLSIAAQHPGARVQQASAPKPK